MRAAAALATMVVFSVPPRPGSVARVAAAVLPLQIQATPMLETNPINHLIKDLSERTDVLRGYL